MSTEGSLNAMVRNFKNIITNISKILSLYTIHDQSYKCITKELQINTRSFEPITLIEHVNVHICSS